MSFPDLSCDVLVIGHGATGCMAAKRLAERGRDVLMVGRGTTATALSTGRVLMGPSLASRKELVAAVRDLGGPYRLFEDGPEDRIAVTNYGTLTEQDLGSRHDWVLEPGERTAVVGIRGLPDLDPDLACRALEEKGAGADCRPYWLDPAMPEEGPVRCSGVPSGREEEAVDLLAPLLAELGEGTVVLPPLFGGADYWKHLDALSRSSGRQVVEPMTPLSLPGLRLQTSMERAVKGSGCRFLGDVQVTSLELEKGVAALARAQSGLREMAIRPRAVVLATGGLIGCGRSVQGGEISDPLGLFAMTAAVRSRLSSPGLTRALSVGLRTVRGKAVCLDGTVTANVFPAGSSVAGLSYPLGRGLAPVLASGLDAAALVEEVL
jgi:anaerobic glycerol-3-phosphate dehydrogenase